MNEAFPSLAIDSSSQFKCVCVYELLKSSNLLLSYPVETGLPNIVISREGGRTYFGALLVSVDFVK